MYEILVGVQDTPFFIFRVLFCLLLILTIQLTQTCYFTYIITQPFSHLTRTWFMLQISGRKVNTVKLTSSLYHHQLSERWVPILQASEYSYPRRSQGMLLCSYNLEANFLPMFYKYLPEIKGHMYLLFLSLEAPHQSSNCNLVTSFPDHQK